MKFNENHILVLKIYHSSLICCWEKKSDTISVAMHLVEIHVVHGVKFDKLYLQRIEVPFKLNKDR